ncbi:MAG: polymer-forming cytoskeletal protein [Arenicellaceae bacterium]|nr:polymer-forming cytoskeletal protein [Arenicellaceae bacterium]
MLSKLSSKDIKAEETARPVETVDTLLGENSTFNGDIAFAGGLRLDGIIRGHITASDSAKGLLVISETGEVEGDITVPHIIINGIVNGNVISSEHVELQGKAKVSGDIQYQGVEMQLGARLNGNLVSSQKSPVRAVQSSKENPKVLKSSSDG